jgi:hypothetical protein
MGSRGSQSIDFQAPADPKRLPARDPTSSERTALSAPAATHRKQIRSRTLPHRNRSPTYEISPLVHFIPRPARIIVANCLTAAFGRASPSADDSWTPRKAESTKMKTYKHCEGEVLPCAVSVRGGLSATTLRVLRGLEQYVHAERDSLVIPFVTAVVAASASIVACARSMMQMPRKLSRTVD